MVKRIFDPLLGLGVFAVGNFFAGAIPQLFMGQGSAESGWGADSVLGHDTYYETRIGFAIVLLSVIAIGLAVLTFGAARARMAALFGGSMIVFLAIMLIYAGSNGYYAGGAMDIIPFVIFSYLTLSGILHWKDAE